MTREDILDNAKVITLPYKKGNHDENIDYDYSDFLKGKLFVEIKNIPLNCYYTDDINNHHMILSWHYNVLMPIVANILNIDYSINDFYLINKKTEYGDYSFLMQKDISFYNIICTKYKNITDNNDFFADPLFYYNIPFNQLVNVSTIYNEDWFKIIDSKKYDNDKNEYKSVFKYFRQCSDITNKSNNTNGKTLLIMGDSHIYPIISILITYYKRVIIMDNCDDITLFNVLRIEYQHIDDILMIMWHNRSVDYYKNCLR